MKLKNSNRDETLKLKFWDETQKTEIVMKLKTSNCDKILKTQIVIKLKNSNCDKTYKLKL